MGFFLLGSLSDFWLQRHAASLSVALIDDVLVGIGAGFLAFLYMTEQKLSEDTKFRYAAIVESSDDAIMGLDSNGTVVKWNKGAERLYGYSAKEAIGRNIFFLSTADDPEDIPSILKRVLKGEVLRNYETVRRRKDGTHVEISLTLSPIIDARGAIVGASGIARDIVERKRAEEALRQSEERVLKAFRGCPAVITLSRLKDRRLIEVNDTFESLTGYRREEVIGRTAADIDLWADYLEREELTNRLLSERSLRDLELHFRAKNGRVLTCLVSAEVIEVGNEPCILTVASDITQRKLAEDALSNMSQKLIQAHEEERTRIARELHDDINQRIALLAVNLNILEQSLPVSAVQTRHLIEEVRAEAKDLGFDIQALSHRLHSSKLEYLGLAKACAGLCRELSDRHGIKIDFQSRDIPKEVSEETTLCLYRVLQEALQNAIKHSGAREFEVLLMHASGKVQLSVHDSGVGFDLEKTNNEPGLGLTSMKERLKLVGGQLSIDSRLHDGTTVHAYVPLNTKVNKAAAGL